MIVFVSFVHGFLFFSRLPRRIVSNIQLFFFLHHLEWEEYNWTGFVRHEYIVPNSMEYRDRADVVAAFVAGHRMSLSADNLFVKIVKARRKVHLTARLITKLCRKK